MWPHQQYHACSPACQAQSLCLAPQALPCTTAALSFHCMHAGINRQQCTVDTILQYTYSGSPTNNTVRCIWCTEIWPFSPKHPDSNKHLVPCDRQQVTFCSSSLCRTGRFPSGVPYPPVRNSQEFSVIKASCTRGNGNYRTKASSWMQRQLALLHEMRAPQHPP